MKVRKIWDSVCKKNENFQSALREVKEMKKEKEKYLDYPMPERLGRMREKVIERRDIKHERNKWKDIMGEEAREF